MMREKCPGYIQQYSFMYTFCGGILAWNKDIQGAMANWSRAWKSGIRKIKDQEVWKIDAYRDSRECALCVKLCLMSILMRECREDTKKPSGQDDLIKECQRNSALSHPNGIKNRAAMVPTTGAKLETKSMHVLFSEAEVASASTECLTLHQWRADLSPCYNTITVGDHIAIWCQEEHIGPLQPWGAKPLVFHGSDTNYRHKLQPFLLTVLHAASLSTGVQNAWFISMEFGI